MNSLRNYLNKIKPKFEKGGKFQAFHSFYEGMETFLFVPNSTSKTGVNIHDSIDSKRIMSFVVIALIPALLFGMYNVGYQHFKLNGILEEANFAELFGYGFLAVLPKIIVCGWTRHRIYCSPMERRRDSGRIPSYRSNYPSDYSDWMPIMDAGHCYRVCRNLCKRNFRRNRYELPKRGDCSACLLVFFISDKNERRRRLGFIKQHIRLR